MSQKDLIRQFSIQPAVMHQSTLVGEQDAHFLAERGDKQWLLATRPIRSLKSGCSAAGVQAVSPTTSLTLEKRKQKILW